MPVTNLLASQFKWISRFVLLLVLFAALFVAGSMVVAEGMPENASSEPGLVSGTTGLLLIAFVNVAVIVALILTSRWSGWKLAGALALTYYGAVTVLTQIETAYFLTSLTVRPQLLARLFIMGVPMAFVFIPLAVLILGKGRSSAPSPCDPAFAMPVRQWIWKLGAIAVLYLALYWVAGYFIAWQNPELRAFYGHPGQIRPFFAHTLDTLRNDPGLYSLQLLRGLLWAACALPVIWSSRVSPWWTAVVVGSLFSLPQNVNHILPNPLMPIASVRLSHMIETGSSTFLFGLVVVWLLHGEQLPAGDPRGSS